MKSDNFDVTVVSSQELTTNSTKNVSLTCLVTGRLYTAGNNKNNQLGYQRDNGDYRPAMVESMSQKGVKHVGCGDTYTIIVTSGIYSKLLT